MTQEPGHSLRSRAPYLPIHKRPKLTLPGGARIAVWTIVNVENWSPLGAMPRTVLPPPMGNPLLPDVPNWAWHEYGMTLGPYGKWLHFDDLYSSQWRRMWGRAIPKTTGRSPRRGMIRLPWAHRSTSSTTLATRLRKAAVHNGGMLWTIDLVTGQLDPQARTTTANNRRARCLGR